MMEYSTLNLCKWYNCRIRLEIRITDKIITFKVARLDFLGVDTFQL